jgi:hypothetical protein
MKPVQRERLEYEGAAVAVSVIFHILLFVLFLNYNVRATPGVEDKPFQFKVSRVDMPMPQLPLPPEPQPQKALGSPQGTKIAPPGIERFIAPPDLGPPKAGVLPPTKLPSPAIPEQLQVGSELPAREPSALDSARVNRELLAIKERETREKQAPARPMIEAPLITTGQELKAPAALTEQLLAATRPGTGSTGMVDGPITQSLTEIFGQGGRGPPLQRIPKPPPLPPEDHRMGAAGAKPSKPALPLEPYVNVEVYNWHAPSDQDGFYQIRITSKANSPLRVVPKDVIFIFDVSGSIGKQRLEQMKAGLRTALTLLNPADRFNIIRFRQNVDFVSPTLLPAAEAGSHHVQRFIDMQHSTGMTDFFGSLLPLSQLNRERGRLLMACVCSDGMPTTGVKDTLEILNRFAQVNARRTSVFTFSGGADVDRFLLGFLAYRNQGQLTYIPDPNAMSTALARLHQALRNPLLLDTSFRFGGINPDVVYPRTLPHFFRDTPLLLYGRYDRAKETGFAMHIRGNDATGQPFEMTVRRYFPAQDNGAHTIAEEWARQKISHLVAQWLDTGNAAHQAEAAALAKRFGVAMPQLLKK